MNDAAVKTWIKKHEGYSKTIYKDTLGNLTVGYGHLLREGQEIDPTITDIWFQVDYARAKRDWHSLLNQYDIHYIGPVRKAVIINMLFNMGLNGVLTFRRMLTALLYKKYDEAADEMLNSQWHKQVKGRAVEMSEMMRTGVIT